MDAKQAATIVKSGNYTASDFQMLYAALKGNKDFAKEFDDLRKQMMRTFAKGASIEVSQATKANTQEQTIIVEQTRQAPAVAQRQEKGMEPWKVQARTDILQWAAQVKTQDIPTINAVDTGLRAEFKDGTKLNFVNENHVMVKTPATPTAQNFDVIVALAKKNHKNVKLGENMTPEFRAALIEACAKAQVQISNMSLDDLDVYMKFSAQPKQQSNTQQQTVASVSRETPATNDLERNKEEKSVVKGTGRSDDANSSNEGLVAPNSNEPQTSVAETVSNGDSASTNNELTQEVIRARREVEEARKRAEDAEQKAQNADAVAQAEKEAREKAEADARDANTRAEKAATQVAEANAVAQAEKEAREKAEADAKDANTRAEKAATQVAEANAVAQAEKEAREKAEADAEDVVPDKTDKENVEQNGRQGNFVADIPVAVQTQGGQDKQESSIPVNDGVQNAEIKTEPSKQKKPWYKRVGNQIKEFGKKIGKKSAAILAGTFAVAVMFVAGRSCGSSNNQSSKDNDGPKTEVYVPTDTLQNNDTISERADTAYFEIAPREWNSSLDVTEREFNWIYNLAKKHDPSGEMWNRMYLNSEQIAPQLGTTPCRLMVNTFRVAAWTTKVNGQSCDEHGAKWANVSSGAFGHILGPVMSAIKCGDQIDQSILGKAKIMLSSVGKDGRINVFTLDKLVPQTSKYNDHDAEGWIIGHNSNVMTDMNDGCGDHSMVGFRMGQKRNVAKKTVVQQAEEKQEEVRPMVINITPIEPVKIDVPTVELPTAPIKVNIPVDTVQTPKKQEKVSVGSKANLSDRPGAEGVGHSQGVAQNGSDKGLTGSQRRAGKKQAKELRKNGLITEEAYQAALEEFNNTRGGR